MFYLLIFSLFGNPSVPTDIPESVHEFTMLDIDGNEVSLSQYAGKTILIVNVASKCGLTPQYAELQALYEELESKDFVILGFPANNFMYQEPGSNEKIKAFCSSKYDVSFPMFSKISVKGSKMAPLYSYLTQKAQNGVIDAPVKWNFQKFLVGKDGKLITSFNPRQKVTDSEVREKILESL